MTAARWPSAAVRESAPAASCVTVGPQPARIYTPPSRSRRPTRGLRRARGSMPGSRDRGGSTDVPAVLSFELCTAGRATLGWMEAAAAAFGDRPLACRHPVHEAVRFGGQHQDVHVELRDVQLLCERAAGECVGAF